MGIKEAFGMSRRAGSIVISLSAGTAQFVADMEKAKAKIHEFGSTGVSETKATRAAFKALEGGMLSNTRAAEQFAEKLLGVGNIAKFAFPVIGGLAFAGMLAEVGKKVYEFYKGLEEAPEKIAGAFRQLNAPLKLTNDELQVSNDRLANDIAKLEGKRQNTLKLALDEARVAADKLADSLDKDLANLYKLLKEENIGRWKNLFGGKAETTDITEEVGGETGRGGFLGRIARMTDEGNAVIGKQTDLKAKDAAQTALNTALVSAYAKEIEKFNRLIQASERTQKIYEDPAFGIHAVADQTARLETLRGVVRQLRYEQSNISLQATNTAQTGRKESLEAAKANAELSRPLDNALKNLDAQIGEIRAKLTSVGKPESMRILAEAAAAANKEITRINEELAKHGTHLDAAGEASIKAGERVKAFAAENLKWAEALRANQVSVDQRIASLRLLADAVGKGYEATRKANIETQVMGAMHEKYGDPQYAADAETFRQRFGAQYDAQHNEQITSTVSKLQDQIRIEQDLARVQAQGAEALRLQTLAWKLHQIARDNDAESARKLTQAEVDLYEAQRKNANAALLAHLNQEISATQRLMAARGEAARRAAEVENVRQATLRQTGSLELANKAAQEIALKQQQPITLEADQLSHSYSNQLDKINRLVAAIKAQEAESGRTLETEIALRDLENQRLRLAVDQALQMKRAQDGVRAFFLEMQKQAKSAAQIIYESLNSALDRVSDQFAKLFTGQKTSFAKMFRELGESMLRESIKSGLQTALGKLAKAPGALGKIGQALGGSGKPDFTKGNAGHVVVDNLPGMASGTSAEGKPDGQESNPFYVLFGAGKPDGTAASPFNVIVQQSASTKTAQPSGPNTLTQVGQAVTTVALIGIAAQAGAKPRAEGGYVSADQAYIVGERGPEPFFPGVAGTILSNASARRTFGGGADAYTYHIDARGADLGAGNRVARAIEASHNIAVSNGVRANVERSKRIPQRKVA
jgi:hypothetical protein